MPAGIICEQVIAGEVLFPRNYFFAAVTQQHRRCIKYASESRSITQVSIVQSLLLKASSGGIPIRIKLNKDSIHSDLVKKVEAISGENLMKCYQCGKCSAGCPAIEEMDILPNEIIRLAQLGCIDEILEANTIWLCASCFTCKVRCPKGVDLSKVMEALRLVLLRKNVDRIKPEALSEEEYRELPQVALVSAFRKKTG